MSRSQLTQIQKNRREITEPEILKKVKGATVLNLEDFTIQKEVTCINIPYKECNKVLKVVKGVEFSLGKKSMYLKSPFLD